jgi:hypothetical protein
MRLNSGGLRRAAAILAVAAIPAILAGPAAAAPTVIGAPDLTLAQSGDTQNFPIVTQLTAPGGGSPAAQEAGTISKWSAYLTCNGACQPVRLVVLRPTGPQWEYTVQAKGPWQSPTGPGIGSFDVQLDIAVGDVIGMESGSGTGLRYAAATGGAKLSLGNPHSGTGQTATFFGDMPGIALLNAELSQTVPANTTVTGARSIVTGGTGTYNVTLDAPAAASPAPAITGTVSLDDGGTPLPGCQNLPVADAQASCQSAAPGERTYRSIRATYSGDANYAAGTRTALYQYVIEPANIQAKASPSTVEQSAGIDYGAEIENVYLDSVGPAGGYDYGTAAFFVDDQPVAECATQPVNEEGLTQCPAVAPAVIGSHTLKVVYSGDELRATNAAVATFDVIGPGAQVSDAVAFGATALNTTVTKTVTLTSTGKVALKNVGVGIAGDAAFSVVTDGCVNVKLATGATCDVTVAYRPTAAGNHSASVMFGAQVATVALSGTGVAPATETPKPTPTAPKGATIDPEKKPTFSVTVPTSNGSKPAGPPTLQLPLSCPALTECELDGKLTIEESALRSGKVKASAAAASTTVAKFSKVQVKAGGLKTVKLKLSAAFVKSAQERGIRRIRATLTINTVLGSGEKLTTAQRITIVIPKAAKKAKVKAKQQVKPRFTG